MSTSRLSVTERVERSVHRADVDGGVFLPCPKRKNRATVAIAVCQQTCRWARTCPVFQAWQRPALAFGT